jgi:tetratricopeptide (TPR) repeat protein
LNELEQYEEAIAAFDKGLEIKPDYHNAWNNRGDAYYLQERQRIEAGSMSYWGSFEKAEKSYEESLSILKAPKPKIEEFHLEALDSLIQVSENLGKDRQAQKLRGDRIDLYIKIFAESKLPANFRKKLHLNFALLKQNQEVVDLAIESGNLTKALLLAEAGKNVCLQWLLQVGEFSHTEYSQIRSFLNSTTAAIYWHQSPATLTTFIIKSSCPVPILISHTRANSELSEAAQRLIEFEEWMEDWDQQYSDYRKQPKDKRSKLYKGKSDQQTFKQFVSKQLIKKLRSDPYPIPQSRSESLPSNMI